MKLSLLSTLSFTALTLAAGCGKAPAGGTARTATPVVRLDSIALSGDSASYMNAGASARLWLKIVGADTTAVSDYLASLAGKPYNEIVQQTFTSTADMQNVISPVVSYIDELSGLSAATTVATVISPYNQSIVTADSTVFIALNHYLGPEHDFYGYFPYYQRRLKDSARISIDVAEALISSRYPYTPISRYPTVLSRLAYEGALVEAVMQATGASEQQVLGLDDEEYQWLTANELPAWQNMLQRDMIFSTDPSTADALVRPNSATTILHPEAPGRAGRFIGHHIVKSYLKSHPDSQISFIISPDFYEDSKLLENAGYVGK